MTEEHAVEKTPDFRDLGLSTPWSAKAWRDAWSYLSDRHETRLWRLVKDLMPLGSYGAPIAAAVALVRALESSVTPSTEERA